MITLRTNGETKQFNQMVRLSSLINMDEKKYFVAKVNNRLRELSYQFFYDAEVEFLGLDNIETMYVYETSLRYLIAMAVIGSLAKYGSGKPFSEPTSISTTAIEILSMS